MNAPVTTGEPPGVVTVATTFMVWPGVKSVKLVLPGLATSTFTLSAEEEPTEP